MNKKQIAVAPMGATAFCPACAKDSLVIINIRNARILPVDCDINNGSYYKYFLCGSCNAKFPIRWIDNEPVPMVNPSNKLDSFLESFSNIKV